MTDVILFHHAHGLTEGVGQFADQLRAAGHHVAVPDLYDGATFESFVDGWPRSGRAPGEPCCFMPASRLPSSGVRGRKTSRSRSTRRRPDDLFVAEGDLDVARDLVATTKSAELFLYPGDQHLFADNSMPAYDEHAAMVLTRRVVSFLNDVG